MPRTGAASSSAYSDAVSSVIGDRAAAAFTEMQEMQQRHSVILQDWSSDPLRAVQSLVQDMSKSQLTNPLLALQDLSRLPDDINARANRAGTSHSAAPSFSAASTPSAKGTGMPGANDAAQAVEQVAESVAGAADSFAGAASGLRADDRVREVLARRTMDVQHHFPEAIAADDFLARVESALAQDGFRGDNTLALTNVCRDESTNILKGKIDEIFGHSFNTNGLGGVLTCGKSGLAAGLSHAPVCDNGRERYVFFAFPHIAICDNGEPATIFRPGREGKSTACGALLFANGAVKEQGLDADCHGIHDHREPEGSILLNRLKRQLKSMGRDPADVDIVGLTKVAGSVITRDLKQLIEQAVDPEKADYAVFTGVQIHSWPDPASGEPTLEYVQPVSAYTVMNGVGKQIALNQILAPSPRQLMMLASSEAVAQSSLPQSSGYAHGTTVLSLERTATAS